MPARTEIFAEGRRKHRLDNVGDWSTSTGDYNTRAVRETRELSCVVRCVGAVTTGRVARSTCWYLAWAFCSDVLTQRQQQSVLEF